MSKILLIETATEVCSAAIAVDGEVVALEESSEGGNHAALLTLQIDTCSKKSGIALKDLDAVAISRGPGAYTSLRVGASVAKGICYALDKPLIAVDTLQALAWAAKKWFDQEHGGVPDPVFIPALDARRQEIWTGKYSATLTELAPAQALILENNLFSEFVLSGAKPENLSCAVICGNGSEKIRNGQNVELPVFYPKIYCSSVHLGPISEKIFQLADFQDIAYFEPFYMKAPNITSQKKNLLKGPNAI
ncbi:MAG: tRNA (adenosine(37)-N6)-threonylcarbamoyltransferase complex dimerization subunit type 1 TsaB [Lewinellaceae bacterium]|nr:tRNA (adenosine(37)-N6)-threonylcarbamoyltransferase complex dimerization subunit type 1 TsaB [Saprospiraceae bacterium]MCB9344419.1 tRNA (adenosine(37)-N6)-threonylcarbamoyltransferase complex dimerization subunit type 1 TsaB [Lewinellaceae bacterium]